MLDKLIRPGENPLLTYLLTYCLTSARRCAHESLGAQTGDDGNQSRARVGLCVRGRRKRIDSSCQLQVEPVQFKDCCRPDDNNSMGCNRLRWRLIQNAISHRKRTQQLSVIVRKECHRKVWAKGSYNNHIKIHRPIRIVLPVPRMDGHNRASLYGKIHQGKDSSCGVISKAVAA